MEKHGKKDAPSRFGLRTLALFKKPMVHSGPLAFLKHIDIEDPNKYTS